MSAKDLNAREWEECWKCGDLPGPDGLCDCQREKKKENGSTTMNVLLCTALCLFTFVVGSYVGREDLRTHLDRRCTAYTDDSLVCHPGTVDWDGPRTATDAETITVDCDLTHIVCDDEEA